MGIKWEHTMRISNRFIICSRDFGLGLLALLLVSGEPVRAAETPGGITHYLRGAYQYGAVLKTNEFVEGDNLKGEPIDTFHAIRLEFGWQTDGSSDWHHLYNFPSYGIGLHGADYFNEEELGKPTSVYGFFNWPAKRWYDYTIKLDNGRTIGVGTIDHPDNPPSTWHNPRYVWMVNPCIVASEPFQVKKDKMLRLRYRLVVHDGPTPTDMLNKLESSW